MFAFLIPPRLPVTGKRKLQGLAFLLVVALLLGLTIAIYNKSFTSTVPVGLVVDRAGHQLDVPADVKVDGDIVGEVRGETTNGNYATLDLELNPSAAKRIPDNVTAMILPKTLFGEKYVDLVLPTTPSGHHLVAHDTIGLDRSKTAIETDQVFNDLLPLLQSLQPAQLNLTLSALADALQGRGQQLGQNLVIADQYFTGFNPHLGTFEQDISGLADLATNYARAAPNLLAMARNFSVNARTVVQKQDVLASFLQGTAGFADTMRSVLVQNEQNLISLANVSLPTLQTLARYSPEFTCLIVGIQKLEPLVDSTFQSLPGSTPALHITLQIVQQPSGYRYPVDLPKNNLDPGPNCDGLPQAPPAPGYKAPPPTNGGGLNGLASIGPAGAPGDTAAVASITAPLLGVSSADVPSFADLLVGPVVRGAAVTYS